MQARVPLNHPVFKVKTAPKDNAKYSIKVYSDMKPRRKVSIQKLLTIRCS
uniref:Uncharacterized protein n=1 Tax=Magallana gigas TaxID=29159 RepID=K1Q482_MAGGI